MPVRVWLLTLTCLAALAADTDTSGSHAVQEIMIPMRDGVALATDIYLPTGAGTGRFPVLLQRTPYNKRRQELVDEAVFFAQHGYMVAVQDCRGRYRSHGTFRSM